MNSPIGRTALTETPFFFRNGPHSLFGVLHDPGKPGPNTGFVLCHAFGEEKLWSHRVFVNFAREAARRGFPTLRFDFMGHGDSERASQDCSVDALLSDIEAAIAELRSNYPDIDEVVLLGLRLGGTLASIYAQRQSPDTPLVLWEPVVDAGAHMQELLRINLSTQLATTGKIEFNRAQLVDQIRSGIDVNANGYLIGKRFFEECENINLTSPEWTSSNGRCLVVQIVRNDKQQYRPNLVQFADQYPAGDLAKVEGVSFWREIRHFCSNPRALINESLDWWERSNAD